MNKKRFDTGKTVQITISECHGELVIAGGQEAAVTVSGHEYEVTESEKGLSIESHSRMALRIPYEASLILQTVHGHVIIKNVNGDIHLDQAMDNVIMKNVGAVEVNTAHNDFVAKNVNGPLKIGSVYHDLRLRNSNHVHLDTVHGDFSARYVNGNVTAVKVLGDINLRTVSGDLSINEGHRDANLRNLGGRNDLQSILGDIRLIGGLAAGKHTFNAAGDMIVNWPEDAPLELIATAPEISNRLDLVDVNEEGNSLNGRMGDGETRLILEAKGRIILKKSYHSNDEDFSDIGFDAGDFDFDFDVNMEGFGEQFTAKISEHMEELSTRLEKKWGPEIASRVESKAQEVAQRAERAAEKAMRRADKAIKQARWQGVWNPPPPPAPSAPPAPKEKKASEEEQLKILRMVENGIISPDEANTLLDALD